MELASTQSLPIEEIINKAVAVLRAGGIVIYPTETTYGVAVDIENPQAVEKLLTYKGKRDGKPISVAVTDKVMASKYVTLNSTADQVYETFLPGPVTVISTGTGAVAPGVASAEGKVGIRIPKYDLALDLIKAFGSGISATGANGSNKKRPYTVADILDNISAQQKDCIDLIIDVGELPHNEPSTVIDTTIDDIVVLRQGQAMFHSDLTVTTQSEEETVAWFEQFARSFRSYYTYTPVLFLFSGQMGAGKTHAVQGLARGVGITEQITSPTYTYANEYTFENESRACRFIHIDCWRMQSFAELQDLGLSSYLEKKDVLAIEWSERFSEDFQKLSSQAKLIWIDLTSGASENTRTIHFTV